jgi:hypothetical protein
MNSPLKVFELGEENQKGKAAWSENHIKILDYGESIPGS